MRAATSVPPPAGNGTMMRRFLLVVCAQLRALSTIAASARRIRLRELTGMGSGTALLATPCLYEFKRLAKQLQILLVVGGIRAIDLDPLPGGAEARRLERHDVVARELQLPRHRCRQTEPDTITADAGEHPVTDEVRVQGLDLSRGTAGQLEEHGVDLRLAGRRFHGAVALSASVMKESA